MTNDELREKVVELVDDIMSFSDVTWCKKYGSISMYEAVVSLIQQEREKAVEEAKVITGETSDGYHTFNELYDHRIALFMALCASVPWTPPCKPWRSKKHSDGSSIEGWFVSAKQKGEGK